MQAGLYPSSHELDLLLGLHYRVARGPPVAELVEPRTAGFVVVEDSTPAGRGCPSRACVYIVVKKSISTPEAAAALSRLLGGRAEPLGLKDTNATTVQRLCLHPCPPRPPRHLVLIPRHAWARLEGCVTSCASLQLHGNQFIIRLKPLPGRSPEDVAKRARSVLSSRLPAYYLYQRFGTRRPSTHYTGLSLLLAPHTAVAREILDTDYPDESPEARRCRRLLWRGCRAPGRMYEPSIAENPGRLPRFLGSIAASAIQAAIFNHYLSARIQEGHPLDKPIPGERRARNGAPLAPVPPIGRHPRLAGEAGRLLREALSRLGLEPGDLEQLPPHVPRRSGYWRPVYTEAQEASVETIDGEVVLRFRMEKGMYATLVLRELVDPLSL
jgi:tRNA pseudouridine13 synthase